MHPLIRSTLLVALCLAATAQMASAADTKIVLVAGAPSHGPGDHEFRSGCLLLQKCLNKIPGIQADVYTNGWPDQANAFDHAAAVLFYMDGGAGHPMARDNHLQLIDALAKKGVGIACAHYAVEIPLEHGGTNFLDWIGGFYESGVSSNPNWIADTRLAAGHPVTRGVQPFKLRDEWYFNIHFRDGMKGVTPLLMATPDAEARQGRSASPRGPFPHILAAAGREEILMWAVENPGANRGFGFTGGHHNQNWGDENFRKLMLNGLLWIAHVEVPANGVTSTLTPTDLTQNLDPKGRR